MRDLRSNRFVSEVVKIEPSGLAELIYFGGISRVGGVFGATGIALFLLLAFLGLISGPLLTRHFLLALLE